MGAVRLGSVRVRGRRLPVPDPAMPARAAGEAGIRALAVAAALCCVLAGCGEGAPEASGIHVAYAAIVAEEDARGEAGLERIQAHLASTDPEVRGRAVRALGRLEDPGLVASLERMLDDPDPRVRVAAAAAMAQAVFGRDPGEVLPLLAARVEGEADPEVIGALATNLGRLAFADPGQRDAAAEALVALADRVEGLGEDPGLGRRLVRDRCRRLERGSPALARNLAAT